MFLVPFNGWENKMIIYLLVHLKKKFLFRSTFDDIILLLELTGGQINEGDFT